MTNRNDYPATEGQPVPKLCYHPRSCGHCDTAGHACGRHTVGTPGHDRCSGRGPAKPEPGDVLG